LNKTIEYKETHDNNKYIRTRKNIIGYMDFCVTDKNIYVLFNKHTLEQYMENFSRIFCKEVRVFDWKGNQVKKYNLEKGAQSIYVFDNKLYALGMDKNYHFQIYVYKIDEDE